MIDAVCEYVEAAGFEIESRATASQAGCDIVAIRQGIVMVVEAKGAGSSKPHTQRYGKVFPKGQVVDHVAKAILKALRVVSEGNGSHAAIALPDNQHHRDEVAQVQPALRNADVGVFWVAGERNPEVVGLDAPWDDVLSRE